MHPEDNKEVKWIVFFSLEILVLVNDKLLKELVNARNQVGSVHSITFFVSSALKAVKL